MVGLIGVFVLRADAPRLFDGLIGRALPVMVVSGVAGITSIALLLARRYGVARITSSVAVATIMIGWAVGQYPYLLLPYLTIEEAAGSRATLVAMTVVLVAGFACPGAGARLHVRAVLPAGARRRPPRGRTPATGGGRQRDVPVKSRYTENRM